MPITGGKAALGIILSHYPDLKVIVMGTSEDTIVISEYLAAGANCYLNKRCSVATFFRAIKSVHSDGYFVDEHASRALLKAALKDKVRSEHCVVVDFNERETEIIREMCDGRTNKEIASLLHLSTSTIDFHKSRIYSKTKCNNGTQLLKYALKNGLVALA
jgi:DNA-binding NarL/FixJ family response regulator